RESQPYYSVVKTLDVIGVVAGLRREHLGPIFIELKCPINRYSIKLVSDSIAQLPLNSTWSLGGADRYGLQTADGAMAIGYAIVVSTTIPLVESVKNAMLLYRRYNLFHGEHKLSGMFPSKSWDKAISIEEFCGEWENKRLNAGDINNHFLWDKCYIFGWFSSRKEQSNGVMEIGCAQTAATTTMHHGRSAIGMCSFFSICPLGLYN
ncbi:hypothetical protein IFM89_010988, partial [Coptis chinensis]